MSKVLKFPLANRIAIPTGAKILSLQSKSDGDFLYALVPDDVEEKETHYFVIVPTGVSFDADNTHYVGSYIEDNFYIYHVFEVDDPTISGGGE